MNILIEKRREASALRNEVSAMRTNNLTLASYDSKGYAYDIKNNAEVDCGYLLALQHRALEQQAARQRRTLAKMKMTQMKETRMSEYLQQYIQKQREK